MTLEYCTCEDVEADTVWPSETLLSPQLAADEWSALRDFVVRGQRALAPDVPDLDVDVVACASLADFLRARPSLERASSGGLRATVHSFLDLDAATTRVFFLLTPDLGMPAKPHGYSMLAVHSLKPSRTSNGPRAFQ